METIRKTAADARFQEESWNYAELAGEKGLGYRVVKRLFDVGMSLIALTLLSPVLLLIAAAVKLEDGGPVFFVQERSGLNGEPFRMFKFRTMCRNAQQMHDELLKNNELDGPAFKMKNDPRITHVGKFLRKTSADELPQLLNVIRGEMSVVGPRPLPVYEAAQCSAYQGQRFLVKPGLTCFWQIHKERYRVSFEEWVELDLRYIRERSLLLDFKLVCLTVIALLRGDGQ